MLRTGFIIYMINAQKISLMSFYYQPITTLTTEDSGQWSLYLVCVIALSMLCKFSDLWID